MAKNFEHKQKSGANVIYHNIINFDPNKKAEGCKLIKRSEKKFVLRNQ